MIDMSNQPIVDTQAVNQETVVASNQNVITESFAVQADSQMPICTVNFLTSAIEALNATVNVGAGTYYNSYYGNSWIMHHPGRSFIKIDTNIEHLDSTKKCLLDLFHLSSIVDGKLMDARISIYVNGKAVICGHNPNNPGYIHEQFDVTDFVVEGNNSIELRFDDGSQTNYWIQSLILLQK